MNEDTYVCDYCQKDCPLTQSNAIEIKDTTNGLIIARVHEACRKAWEDSESLKRHQSVSTFQKLK